MYCPKCNGRMETVREEQIDIDRCPECGGIWFDALEAEDLIDAEAAKKVDIGSRIKGMKMNAVHDIKCPRCGEQMQTVSDNLQPHIHFEVCAKCHGYFLDAGELRDMQVETAAEKIGGSIAEKARWCATVFKLMHEVEKEPGEGEAPSAES